MRHRPLFSSQEPDVKKQALFELHASESMA